MLSAWRQACAASGRHTSLSLRCKDGKREAERPGAMFVVVLARGTSRGIILTVFFARRPSCGPAAWRYFTRLVQSDQTWAYRRSVFTSPALRNMQFFKAAPYKNKRFQEASFIKNNGLGATALTIFAIISTAALRK